MSRMPKFKMEEPLNLIGLRFTSDVMIPFSHLLLYSCTYKQLSSELRANEMDIVNSVYDNKCQQASQHARYPKLSDN